MIAWNADTARHLLARTLFGYNRDNLTKALSYNSVDAFVNGELLSAGDLWLIGQGRVESYKG